MSRLSPHTRIPGYCLHKARGTGYVRLNGHVHYLPGPYGGPESRQEYDRLVGLWQLNGRQLPAEPARPLPAFAMRAVPAIPTPATSPLTPATMSSEEYAVAELCADYLAWAETYYVRDGHVTQEINTIENAFKPLLKLYGTTPLTSFGPKALKVVRQAFIERSLVRGMVNKYVSYIKRAVKWAVSEEKVPGEVFHRLLAVDGLRKGRSEAPDGEPVRPVDDKVVAAFLPHVPKEIRAMIEIAQLTGMRPTEVCLMRASDIDMTKEVWAYRPMRHKTERYGIQRTIAIGPKAQAIISPFLVGDPTQFLFSPAKAEKRRRKEATNARTTPQSCGNRPGTNRVDNPQRTPGDHYTDVSFRQAIIRAVPKVYPMPAALCPDTTRMKKAARQAFIEQHGLAAYRKHHQAVLAWYAERSWHPNQLRHSLATRVRSMFKLDAAQVVLGHQKADTTQIYAEANFEKAAEVMRQVG